MRQRRTALKRRNHLGTHKCQNPISAPLVQDKSYTVRRGLHMFPWGSSGSHYGNERGQITRYRSLSKAGTKSRRSILWIGALNKRGLNPAPLPPPTSNKLLQRGEQPENSISSHLCHPVSPNYTVLLFCRSEITAPSLLFHRPRISHMSRQSVAAARRPVWSRVGALSSSLHLGKAQNSFRVRSESRARQKVTAGDNLSVFPNELASPPSVCSITVDTDPYKQSPKC